VQFTSSFPHQATDISNDGRHDNAICIRLKARSPFYSEAVQFVSRSPRRSPHPQTGALLETSFVRLTSLRPDLLDLVLDFLDFVLVSSSFVVRNLRFEFGHLLLVLPKKIIEVEERNRKHNSEWCCFVSCMVHDNDKRRRQNHSVDESRNTYFERVASSTTFFFPLAMLEYYSYNGD